MSEKLLTTNIKRVAGNLYFVKSNEEGFLEIFTAKAGRPSKK